MSDKIKKYFIGGYILSYIGDDRKHSCILSKYNNSPSDFALLKSFKKNKINSKKQKILN